MNSVTYMRFKRFFLTIGNQFKIKIIEKQNTFLRQKVPRFF